MSIVPPARPPTRLFDWKLICPDDVARPFPAVVGVGRGKPIEGARKARKVREADLTPEEKPA